MVERRLPLVAAALLCAAGPAQAGGTLPWLPEGDGYAELYAADFGDGTEHVGIFGDFMLSFRPEGQAFGFDVGTLGARSSDHGNGIFYWAGTWYTSGGGKLSVGNPRPAYGLFATSAHNAAHGPLGSFNLRSQVEIDEFRDGGAQYGASYLGGAGALKFGASAHRYQFEDIDTWGASVGASYAWSQYEVAAAVERSDDDLSRDISRFKLGLAADYGRFGFGTTYRVTEVESDTGRSWESFLSYEPTDRIEITGTFLSYSDDEDSVTGLAAKYALDRGGYLRIGTVRNGEAAYSAAVGFEF